MSLSVSSTCCLVQSSLDFLAPFEFVNQRDIVIRLKSLTFAWTALSGFQSTGIPFFSQAALLGFHLAGCTIFFVLSLIFARTFLVRQDALIFAQDGQPSGSLSCVVPFDYVGVHRMRKIVTIHGGKYHSTARK